ncbi:MAG: hypothetical protein FKY71_05180 [Spiribacter salinus]|uniref:IraD/Gp25-like domain-containing protein n=1 Tax=Spiribacter salinus TaxID=1335746 RepID=A0A540VTM1_9GAMM|nr:MAG: hypothetical protein FKY71_05180 [Spiribacter salinus]
MSFASAFLNMPDDQSIEVRVGRHVETLLQSVAPEQVVGPELPHVRVSNLCFGVPMDWALGEGQRNTQVRSMLRDRLEKFEPRLALMSEISLQEDTAENSVTFYIAGAVRTQGGTDKVEIVKTLSRMDQYAEGTN